MIVGGMGNISDSSVKKNDIDPGSLIIVLGGPAMLIGLGGGSASSLNAGSSDSELDFASVQETMLNWKEAQVVLVVLQWVSKIRRQC